MIGNVHPSSPRVQTIDIDHVMPGADVIHVGNHQIALGFPEEVVKGWMRAGKKVSAWLIPDTRAAHGIVQWALEFPLYHALFMQGAFAQGCKIPVLVHPRDWTDVLTYLRLTLLGLTREELTREGVAPAVVDMLVAEGNHLALKHPDGRIASVEDFLHPHFFDQEGVVEFQGLRVKSHGNNVYSFYAQADRVEEYRLEIPADQAPPYTTPLTPGNAPVVPQPFEVITLGTGNGFDTSGPCSSILVQANGRFMLVDCGPHIKTLLNHAGVSVNQVHALVLTHAHEDHAVGLSALLMLTHRLKLFVTRENAAIMRRKLAILNPHVSSPSTLLDDAFDVVCVEPERDYSFLGLKMRFHYTMHSIPCTGVQLSIPDGATERSVIIVGDHNSRANVEKAAHASVISPARLEQLRRLYTARADLVIADAGAGPIHGLPADFADSPSSQVVYVHTTSLKEPDRALFTLARPGYRYTIIPECTRPTPLERGLAHKALLEAFPHADTESLSVLLDGAIPQNVNRDHVVVRRGETSRDLYIVITGELGVLAEQDGHFHKVAQLHAGEIFGEMAAIQRAPRSASVVAETPARLLRVPAEAFGGFAEGAELALSLPDVWAKRKDLDKVEMLHSASVTTRNQLAWNAVRKVVPPGTTLIRESSMSDTVFVLVAGRVQVYKGVSPLMVGGVPVLLEPGALLGETAPFLKAPRNASIVTLDECEVLALRGADFKRIIQKSPHLFCSISRVVRQRQAA